MSCRHLQTNHAGDKMQLITAVFFTLVATMAAPAIAQQTGGFVAQCQIMGQPVTLQLQYERIGGAGPIYAPNGDIRSVVGDGSSTTYWNGAFVSPNGQQMPVSGENRFLRFYDQNAYNRETVLEVTETGAKTFYLTDVYGNYPGNHPCQVTNVW